MSPFPKIKVRNKTCVGHFFVSVSVFASDAIGTSHIQPSIAALGCQDWRTGMDALQRGDGPVCAQDEISLR